MALAVADTALVPVSVALLAGAVMDTVGGVVAVGLLTVTVILLEVVTLPLVSVATAVRVWMPLLAVVVSQVRLYGLEVTRLPNIDPSSSNSTLAIVVPGALALALADTLKLEPETVEPLVGAVIDTVGGVVAVGLLTVTVMPLEVVTLPLVSVAIALRVCVPLVAVVVSKLYV